MAYFLEGLTFVYQEIGGLNLERVILGFFLPTKMPACCQKRPKFRWFECHLPLPRTIQHKSIVREYEPIKKL